MAKLKTIIFLLKEELKISVVEYLKNVCNITDKQIDTIVENIKLLQVRKFYKKIFKKIFPCLI